MSTNKNQELFNPEYEEILKLIQPGDVIVQQSRCNWYQINCLITHFAINYYHKRLFGKNSLWKVSHAMLYFDDEHTFSIEAPITMMKPLQKYWNSDFYIYRLTLFPLNKELIDKMLQGIKPLLDTKYDYGQILDVAINYILGFKNQRRLKLFDLGRKRKICSVGVRVAFENLFKNYINKEDKEKHKWLFTKLNKAKWSPKYFNKFKGTDIEATSPAHFSNSDFFNNEFELIAHFKNGKRIQ